MYWWLKVYRTSITFLDRLSSIQLPVLLLGERRVRLDFLKIMKDQINRKPYSFVPWQLKDVTLAILLWFIGTVTIGIIVLGLTDPTQSLAIIITLVTNSFILIFLSLRLGPLRYRSTIRTLGLIRPTKLLPSLLLWPIAALLANSCFLALYISLLSVLNIAPPDPVPFNTNLSIMSLAIIGLFVIVIGPLAEELFFRGFIFPAITKRFGLFFGAVGNALVFSLFHIDPVLYLPTFVAGLILTFLYTKTHSLTSSFIAHGTQNCIAFLGTIAASDLEQTTALWNHMLY